MDFRRVHTRGNPNTKTLQSVENPERILRNRNKEKVNIPQFGASSSQDLHNIPESEWEISVERLLSKSKSESDLKKVEINPSRLESYVLESLWKNVLSSVKTTKAAPIFQNFQLPISQPV